MQAQVQVNTTYKGMNKAKAIDALAAKLDELVHIVEALPRGQNACLMYGGICLIGMRRQAAAELGLQPQSETRFYVLVVPADAEIAKKFATQGTDISQVLVGV